MFCTIRRYNFFHLQLTSGRHIAWPYVVWGISNLVASEGWMDALFRVAAVTASFFGFPLSACRLLPTKLMKKVVASIVLGWVAQRCCCVLMEIFVWSILFILNFAKVRWYDLEGFKVYYINIIFGCFLWHFLMWKMNQYNPLDHWISLHIKCATSTWYFFEKSPFRNIFSWISEFLPCKASR